jgi:hypothetical protein
MTTNFFHPSLLLLFLDPGAGIRDPGSGMGKNQDPGSEINIPDPQHCSKTVLKVVFSLSFYYAQILCRKIILFADFDVRKFADLRFAELFSGPPTFGINE